MSRETQTPTPVASEPRDKSENVQPDFSKREVRPNYFDQGVDGFDIYVDEVVHPPHAALASRERNGLK